MNDSTNTQMTLSEAESCWSISGSPHHPHKSAHFKDVVTEALGRGGDCQAPRPCPQPMRYGGTSHWALRAGSEGRPTLQGVKPRQEAEPFTARKRAAEVSGSRDMRLSVATPTVTNPGRAGRKAPWNGAPSPPLGPRPRPPPAGAGATHRAWPSAGAARPRGPAAAPPGAGPGPCRGAEA